ncbi:MAG: hypothetical protein RLZZ399_162 [Verrucomicrobiota bacterium]|jgi:iron complex transport system ATP-binding protein
MSRPPAPILDLHDLCVIRDGIHILDNLSWTVRRGEHWVILGPNGSGKSSLLSALAGYLTPTSGGCQVLGETFGESDWRELRTHLGIVAASIAAMIPPEEPAASTVLTGRNGGIGLWGPPKAHERQEALHYLAEVEATHLEDRRWEVLSQGEKQRVLIARALIGKPKILVLDEPCAGLDPVARECFLAFLERLLQRPRSPAVALVTHHVEEIVTGFTHALLLKGGRCEESGPLDATLRTPVLESIFETPLELRKRNGRYRLKITTSPRGLLSVRANR